MAAAKIYKEIDYPTGESSILGNSVEDSSQCPQTYPPSNHPNTILAFRKDISSSTFDKALTAKFIVSG